MGSGNKILNDKIKEAIAIGRKRVILPSMIPFVMPYVAYVFLKRIKIISIGENELIAWFGVLFVFAFAASWLIWSVQIPKWRLQAYSMVDDIEELKKAAIAASLIWSDDCIFTKTEIATDELKQSIRDLEESKRIK